MFFDTAAALGLEVEERWEMEAQGGRRAWGGDVEVEFGERKEWVVIARLKRREIAD